MLISELIEKLQEIQNERGDIEVCADGQDIVQISLEKYYTGVWTDYVDIKNWYSDGLK